MTNLIFQTEIIEQEEQTRASTPIDFDMRSDDSQSPFTREEKHKQEIQKIQEAADQAIAVAKAVGKSSERQLRLTST